MNKKTSKARKRSLELMQGIEQKDRKRGLDRIYMLLALLLFIAVSITTAAVILPPHTELASLKEEREAKQQQLERAQERKRQAQLHVKRMEDPEYAEQIARDMANQALADETIIRIEPVSKPQPTTEETPRRQAE